ncbi:WXG100 family type VII secretion target [Dactylosporangium sp. NPDC005555]|uniref:WXG100 family type VII secretion target n=1 Tax=Dactylosporangium sp. NPDC005555 TaxID=3154889 RepID=UPI0033B4B16F
MATYALDPNGLLDSGMELRGVTRSIETALDDLNGYVNQFIAANAGGAASSYSAAQTTWNGGLTTMQNALDRGAAAIDNIRDNYHVADTQGAALFEGNV